MLSLSSSGPELKKSISMKMRYKMSLNKHRVPFFRVYIVSRAFHPSSSSFFLRAFPSFFVVTVHHDTLVRARAQLRKILKLFYLKFYNSHGETERVGRSADTTRRTSLMTFLLCIAMHRQGVRGNLTASSSSVITRDMTLACSINLLKQTFANN